MSDVRLCGSWNLLLSGIVLFGLFLPQQGWCEDPVRVVSVSAQSEFRVTPDEAIIAFSVETQDRQLPAAKVQNDAITGDIFDFVQEQQISEDSFRVTALQIGPRYDRNRQPVGYGVTRSFEVRTPDFALVDRLISGIVDAGGDDITIDELKLQLRDQREHQVEARRLAVEYARAKATHLAELNNMVIGDAVSISEDVEYNDDAGGFGGFGGGLARADREDVIPRVVGAAGKRRLASRDKQASSSALGTVRSVSLSFDESPAQIEPQPGRKAVGEKRDLLLSPGQISLNATVQIEFELLPRK